MTTMVTPRAMSSTAMMSCRPSTQKLPLPVWKALDHRDQALHQRGEGDAEHDDERREQHLVVAAGDFHEHAERDEHQRRQQLVGGAEQRPDVAVADLGQDEAVDQRVMMVET